MIHEIVNLKEHFPIKNDVYLECYVMSNYEEYNKDRKRKSVIIFPGGGYEMVSEREAEPVAVQFLSADISSFVLRYSTTPNMYPVQLLEGLAAVAYVRKNAERYNLDPKKICVCGFSAGGHLAACCAAFHHHQEYANQLKVTIKDTEVNGLILAYPVISMQENSHEVTCYNITHGDKKLMELLSIEKQVTDKFPKTFIWHTKEDETVSCQNSIDLCKALEEKHIFYEFHLFEKGMHGLSLANEITAYYVPKQIVKEVQQWVPMCLNFVKNYI